MIENYWEIIRVFFALIMGNIIGWVYGYKACAEGKSINPFRRSVRK